MPLPVPELLCVVCEQDALKPREVLYCEACDGLHHVKCGEVLWVIRDNEDYAHTVCGNCADLEELDEQ